MQAGKGQTECPSCALPVEGRPAECPYCEYEFPGRSGKYRVVMWVALGVATLWILDLVLSALR